MSLYRTYRPKTFGEVIGQPHVVAALSKALTTGNITHAYLFQGPRGTGKTTLARLLAKRLNCQKAKKDSAEPCNKCDTCTAAKNGSLDVIEIDAASNRGIDDIRALREHILTAPAIGKYKVYIIDEVHMLTGEAFAALLKTLEEPVSHAVFVLATTELHKVPETIASRCQVFRFKRASEEEMKTRLQYILKQEKQKLPEDIVSFVISRSDGCYRDAESLLGQILSLKDSATSIDAVLELLGMPSPQVVTDFITALEQKDVSRALTLALETYEKGYDPELFIEEAIRASRDTSVSRIKKGESAGSLTPVIRNLVQAKQDLAYVPEPLIALELAVLASIPANAAKAPPVTPQPIMQRQTITPTKIEPMPPISQTPVPEAKPEPSEPGTVSLEQVQSAWSAVIAFVKPKNPAASTFLRAMEATAVNGNTVTVSAQYALHRNFFEKPENKQFIIDAFQKELQHPLEVKISLTEKSGAPVTTTRKVAESELLQNVQEIFGEK